MLGAWTMPDASMRRTLDARLVEIHAAAAEGWRTSLMIPRADGGFLGIARNPDRPGRLLLVDWQPIAPGRVDYATSAFFDMFPSGEAQ